MHAGLRSNKIEKKNPGHTTSNGTNDPSPNSSSENLGELIVCLVFTVKPDLYSVPISKIPVKKCKHWKKQTSKQRSK